MHFIGQREKGSKIYLTNIQSIPLANDRVHQKINESINTEPIHILQKKNIDKIMLAVVKQRMFGQLLMKDNRTSLQSYHTIDLLSKGRNKPTDRTFHCRLTDNSIMIDLPYQKRKGSYQKHMTIDKNKSQSHRTLQTEKSSKKRQISVKLPQLLTKKISNFQETIIKQDSHHHYKFKIHEKKQLERFKAWLGGNINNVVVYDLKVSRQTLINKYKKSVNSILLQRFLHFFGFPQNFTLRQYCALIENAANCNLKFIYFWVFGLFDENSNGILQSQDLFRFLQKFGSDNQEIEHEIYELKKYLQEVEQNFKPREQKQLTEEILIVNHSLKLDQLKDLLKESQKERIDVDCVKSTCYHQSVLSIQHQFSQRDKLQKIEDNELSTKKLKEEMNQIKVKLQNTPGLRLRDLYAIYVNKRPKIFRFVIKLLTGEEISIFQ